MGPYGPAWARPGPTQYAKPFRKLTLSLEETTNKTKKNKKPTSHVLTYHLSAPDFKLNESVSSPSGTKDVSHSRADMSETENDRTKGLIGPRVEQRVW